MALLEVDDLTVRFYTEDGVVRAVNGVSWEVERGEKFGVVGESGAGKSVTSLSVMRLIDRPGVIEGGSIRYRSADLVERLAAEFPEATLDVDRLRRSGDLRSLIGRLYDDGVTASDLTGGRYEDVEPGTLVRDGAVTVDDIVERGYAHRLGHTEDRCFVVDAGDEGYVELTKANDAALRRVRGDEIAMVFQDPQTALNPVYTVGEQIAEGVRAHRDVSDAAARDRAVEVLESVGIPDPEERYSDYPHQFSGGMQQRVVIAIALALDPNLVIADEPTTALDVTIEAQILELLDDLAAEFDTAIQLITHDLGVIATLCDRVMVMYAGEAVETAPVANLYYEPKHPYTVGLMGSIPRIGDRRDRLDTIPGTMPDLVQIPTGCPFHPRCPYAEEVCTETHPPLAETAPVESRTTERRDAHTARCLEYTGDLAHGLDFEVIVDDGSEPERPVGDGEPLGGDPS